jgi:hypothetical protein
MGTVTLRISRRDFIHAGCKVAVALSATAALFASPSQARLSRGTGTDAAGTAVNNATMQILRQNGATNSGHNQIAAASFGGSLSSGQVASYYSRMKTYMTAVGVCGVITCP